MGGGLSFGFRGLRGFRALRSGFRTSGGLEVCEAPGPAPKPLSQKLSVPLFMGVRVWGFGFRVARLGLRVLGELATP